MKNHWMTLISLAAALLLASAAPSRAADVDPAAQTVQSFYNTLLDSMKHAKELGLQGRYNKLKPAVEQAYDLQTMTKFAAGPGWANFSPSDQQALVTAFERMTVASYASNFDGFSGEKFTVDPAVQVRGTDKVVQSKLVTGNQTIPFNYRMRGTGSSWKIVDVYLNGTISQLATRRSDFASTAASGAPALIKKINDLTDEQMKK
jgi:phospholipid transport system substrate-binding protein